MAMDGALGSVTQPVTWAGSGCALWSFPTQPFFDPVVVPTIGLLIDSVIDSVIYFESNAAEVHWSFPLSFDAGSVERWWENP